MRIINEIFSVNSTAQMQLTREMGIQAIGVSFPGEDASEAGVRRILKEADAFGLSVVEGGAPALQKCPSIIWGKEDRDRWIDAYNEFTRILGNAGIPVNYVAWQPNGMLRSGVGPGKLSHGSHTFLCDLDEMKARGPLTAEQVGEDKMWDNFKYFLDRTLPVCEKEQVRMALHPNDPPLPEVCGIPSLVWNTECFRKAFALAGNSPWLGMKLCTGCWLENPEFGNLMEDIREFSETDKIITVHFRNVSSPLPVFEETLVEDGYADMISVMEQLVRCQCCANISIDHAFFRPGEKHMSETSRAYMTGYLKGMLHTVQKGRINE